MQVSIASPYWSYYPGQEATLTDELAQVWHECGHCKIVGDAEETAEQTHTDTGDSEATPESAGDTDGQSNNTSGDGTIDTGDGEAAPESVGDTDGQSDNTTSDGTTDTGDGEAAPKGRRSR